MAKKKKSTKLPRKQKKALKKSAQKVVQRQTGKAFEKVSTQEAQKITKKENARIRRNEQAKARREEFKKAVEKSGIPTSVLKANNINSITALNNYIPKYNRQQQKAERISKKKQYLIDAGFTPEEATEIASKDPSFKKLQSLTRNDRFTYTAKEHLYIGFADTTGQGIDVHAFDGYTTAELKESYFRRLSEAEINSDGSYSMAGVYVFDFGSRDIMTRKAKVFYERGYNLAPEDLKLDAKQYSKLTVSNKWNEFEFWRLACTCANQMKNEQVLELHKTLQRYCGRNNLPFMD